MDKIVDIRPLKAEIRTDVKKKRTSMSAVKKQALDLKIQNRLMNTWTFRDASVILTYVSTPIEVDTRHIIKASLESGKIVAVPKCGEKHSMDFYIIDSFEDLTPGAFGVLEPSGAENKLLGVFSDSICIVPAFSFDKSGFRLGYGKGYYDRFLSRYDGAAVGICYNDCVSEHLPHGKFDKAVQLIVTEKDIIYTAEEG